MQNISGFGLTARVIASVTFPSGFNVTAFADDADPLDIPALTLADKAMGLNGDFVVWSQPHPIEIVLNVIPTSPEDINFNILADGVRYLGDDGISKGKSSARDVITIALTYPNGTVATLSEGIITSAIISQPVANSGRMKTKPYNFAFANIVKSST